MASLCFFDESYIGTYYNPFRCRGYYYDKDLDLYYLNARYYDGRTGRFISPDYPDVVMATPGALTDKNLYEYCDNNPVMRVDGNGAFWGTVFDVISLGMSVADVINNPSDVWSWIGLVGDVVDLLPIVSGVGEATDAMRFSSKTGDIINPAGSIKAGTKMYNSSYDSKERGWKVGDDISNLTKAGNRPSWTTVRQQYWKNIAHFAPDIWSDVDLQRMKKGLAPIRGGAPMELHHPKGRIGENFYIFYPVTQLKHDIIHYGRKVR